MTMGGNGPEVLTTLTTNPGKILDGLHRTKTKGQSHFHTAIMIASVCRPAHHITPDQTSTDVSLARTQTQTEQVATAKNHCPQLFAPRRSTRVAARPRQAR